MITQNKRLAGIVLSAALLLFIPLTAMQLTDEVNWSRFDFIVMGALLLGTGFLCELVLRNVKKFSYRIAVCTAILAALVIAWLELAVGVFGTPFAGT